MHELLNRGLIQLVYFGRWTRSKAGKRGGKKKSSPVNREKKFDITVIDLEAELEESLKSELPKVWSSVDSKPAPSV